MNRSGLISAISQYLKLGGIRKTVKTDRHILHVTDDDGNTVDFSVPGSEKTVALTKNDIDAVLSGLIRVVEDALRRGEPVSLRGFGSWHLKEHKGSVVHLLGPDGARVDLPRYVAKFHVGHRLRLCARTYDMGVRSDEEERELADFDDSGEDIEIDYDDMADEDDDAVVDGD